MPGDTRDLFEDFFLDFCARFPDWMLADMHTERGVETKLIEALHAYADDDQCTKIFFAGWQRPPHFAGLSNKPEKVTLVQGHTMAPGLERIGFRGPNMLPMALDITTFTEVFVSPTGRDLFRCNFLTGSGYKSWVCSDSIKGKCSDVSCRLAHLPVHSVIVSALQPKEPEKSSLEDPSAVESYDKDVDAELSDLKI